MTELLTEKQLIAKLSPIERPINRLWIYRLRKKGLPVIKVGGFIRYDYDDVVKWLKNYGKDTLSVGETNEG